MRYFYVHDAAFFRDHLTPALGDSWRRCEFGPLAGLAAELAPTFAAFAERFRLTADEQPLVRRAAELRFDRRTWRHLAGELLLYAAADAPEIASTPEPLERLLGPADWLRPAHEGSRDVRFGDAAYRPGSARLNDEGDVARIAAEWSAIDAATWDAAALLGLPGCDDADDCADELDVIRERFVHLGAMYHDAAEHGRVVVCEEV